MGYIGLYKINFFTIWSSKYSALLYTHDPQIGQKVRIIFILQEVMLHIKLKAKNCRTYLHVCLMRLLGWIKRCGIEIMQISVF